MPHDLDGWKPVRFGLSSADDRCGSGDQVYVLLAPDDIKVFSRGRDRLLVYVAPDGFMVRWALLLWTSELEEGKDPQYSKIAFGYGFSGSLREPRHTWMGRATTAATCSTSSRPCSPGPSTC
jgi:hypothetical protein